MIIGFLLVLIIGFCGGLYVQARYKVISLSK
jgi:hypothetical protein